MNHEEIARKAIAAANELHQSARQAAKQVNCRLFSRGYEFLSLDANGERDEAIVDYCDRDEMTAEKVAEMVEDCRKAGSPFLNIGYGVDAANNQRDYDDGDYEPMFDWVDMDDIAVS